MAIRKFRLSGKWRPIRAFTVLVLIAGATSLGAAAWAGDCAAVDVVVARGTGEPGTLGAVIGDPLYDALAQRLPDSSAYAVRYPADLLVPSSVGDGIADMTGHLAERAARCPGERFVLVGYSQGALVVHGVLGTAVTLALPGARTVPPAVDPAIAAVLLFGDPLRTAGWQTPGAFAWRTGNYCSGGDPICGSGAVFDAHTDYGWAIQSAAQFAVDRI